MTEIPQYYLNPQEPSEELENDEKNGLKKTVIFEWTPDNQGFSQGQVDKYIATSNEKFSITSTVIAGTNTSLRKQVTEAASKLKNGPYNVHGKNNKLYIHNTKANGKVVAYYKYNGGNGELLSFNVDGDFITRVVEVSKTTQIDPKVKKAVTKIQQTYMNPDGTLAMSNPDGTFKGGKRTVWHPDALKANNGIVVDNTYHKPFEKNIIPTLFDKEAKEIKHNSYKSEEDAIKDIVDNYEASEDEISEYFQRLKEVYDKRMNPETIQDANEYRDLLKNGVVYEDFIAKRKVSIYRKTIDPVQFSSAGKDSEYMKKLNQSKEGANIGFTRKYRNEYKQLWQEGYNHLKTNPNIKILTRGNIENGSLIEIEEQKELSIPVPGVRVLSSGNLIGFGQSQANDTLKSIYNQLKANATVIGRPTLTSSINIYIDGIGSKYSGTWYIKKVKHSLDSQGYTCDIDFRKRDIPIRKHVIKTSINTQKAYMDLNKISKQSFKTGDWMTPGLLQISVEKWKRNPSTPNKNYLIIQDQNNPKVGKVYEADADFKTSEFDNINITPVKEFKVSDNNLINGGIDDE